MRTLTFHRSLKVIAGLVAFVVVHLSAAPAAAAGTPSLTAVGRLTAPILTDDAANHGTGALEFVTIEQAVAMLDLDRYSGQSAQGQEQREPPPVLDPESGAVFSLLGGSVFTGSSAFQTGAAFAYFFGDKASFGFEVEGNVTFGPAGRVTQGLGSFIWQLGARTSKFVPYFAIGLGYVYAKAKLPDATQAVLDEFGIVPEPETEQGPMFHYGGGLRFYVAPSLAFRVDARFALVPLDLPIDPGFSNSLYGMSRIAGMLSWDF